MIWRDSQTDSTDLPRRAMSSVKEVSSDRACSSRSTWPSLIRKLNRIDPGYSA